jgi:iron complex outermembrane receptor protein
MAMKTHLHTQQKLRKQQNTSNTGAGLMFKQCKMGVAIVAAAGLTSPGIALSQSGSGQSGSGESRFGLEEVVVSARKTSESIQDIPLSVQAFTAETIGKQQIVNIEDVIKFTPGVVTNNPGASRRSTAVRFRGIEPPNDVLRGDSTSSAFLDGVYLSGSSQWVSMFNMERVEVVKGPQSAFFGRSTFAGAINYISKKPSNEFGVDVQAIVGDFGRQDLWLAAEGPIIKDKLAARVSGRYYRYDGAWDNNPPADGSALPFEEFGDIGARESDTYNITLLATPTDNLSINLQYMYNEDDDGPATQFIIRGENNNCGPFNGGTATYYCGTLSSSLLTDGVSIDTSPPVDSIFSDDLGWESENEFTSLNVEWDIAGSGYVLTSTSGWYEETTQDYRGQIPDEIDNYANWTDETFSQEFRIASPQDARFRWMIGAYYLDLKRNTGESFGVFPSPGPQGPFPPGVPRGQPTFFPFSPLDQEEIENRAIFGSIGFDITESLTLSVELRREEETIDIANSVIQEAPPLDSSTDELAIATAQPFGGAEIPLSAEFTATLPRVILDYTLSDATMLYASYSEGNNPGGFNTEVIQLEPTVALPAFQAANPGIGYNVEQASLDNYEFGVKHSLANGRGFINGALYFMEWTNQAFGNFSRNTDSNGDGRFVAGSDRLGAQVDYQGNGSTDIWGFELAGSYAITPNWIASAGYNYTKTDIQEFLDGQALRVLGSSDVSGNEIAQTPNHTANVSLDFNMPAGDMFGQEGGEWFGRWDAWYQSESYNWVINLAESEAAWLHNLRGGWRNDRFSVMAWVENVFDDDPVLASRRTTGSFLTGTLGYFATLPEPRTVGITVTASFR